jgi:16S rRNA (cytosine967-C5)-methyltransferase
MRLLDAVLRKGLPLEAAMASATASLERADDRGFAHAIAAEALRRLPDLDALIDSATPKPMPADAKPRFALRIALTQALALEHAAACRDRDGAAAGGRGPKAAGARRVRDDHAARRPAARSAASAGRRWGSAGGALGRGSGGGGAACDCGAGADRPDLPRARRGAGRAAGGVALAVDHVRMPAGTAVAELPGYAEGAWWVQDIAASIPARLAGRGDGTAIDLCAAPGGKTMQLAAAGGGRPRSTFRRLVWRGSPRICGGCGCKRRAWSRTRRCGRPMSRPTWCCSTRPVRRPASSAGTRKCSIGFGRG